MGILTVNHLGEIILSEGKGREAISSILGENEKDVKR
jgi:hypothetical protein